jgi:hypothetical protein
MKKILIIKADTNDADYVEESNEITDDELRDILPVIEAIKKYKGPHNWPEYEYSDESPFDIYPQLTEDQIEAFSGLTPTGEYGIHTIESIRLLTILDDQNLL